MPRSMPTDRADGVGVMGEVVRAVDEVVVVEEEEEVKEGLSLFLLSVDMIELSEVVEAAVDEEEEPDV